VRGGQDLGRLRAIKVPTTAENDEDAKWKLALPAADVAQFQSHIDDVLIICEYRVLRS